MAVSVLKAAAAMARADADAPAAPKRPVLRMAIHNRNETFFQSNDITYGEKRKVLFWQEEVLTNLMDIDIPGLRYVLADLDEAVLHEKLKLTRIPPQAVLYVLGDEMFSPKADARELLGSSFRYERQEVRVRIGRWLEMINAQEGDTLLHLALRVNGAEFGDKANLVVELLGHGLSFEVPNAANQLPPQIDPKVFRHALFRLLEPWKQARELRDKHQRNVNAAKVAAQAHEKRLARREARRAARDAVDAEARRLAQQQIAEEEARIQHHAALHQTIDKVLKREAREAFKDHGSRELWKDTRAWVRRVTGADFR